MPLKFSVCALAVLLAANLLTCSAQTKRGGAKPSPTPPVEARLLPEMSPEEIANIRELMFADTPLEELVQYPAEKIAALEEGPERSFVQAAEEMRRGRRAEAKKHLKHLLSLPNVGMRVQLIAWSTLRRLGERPPPGAAGKVRGVVMELHNEEGVGTLAAYADGSVRWLGGKGKVSTIELPIDDQELGPFVRDFLKAAAAIVGKTPAAERRRPGVPPFEHFRVSVLTFGGIHVIELHGPSVSEEHFVVPMMITGGGLVEAILKFEEAHPAKPPPPAGKP